MLPGETLSNGAPWTCPGCGKKVNLHVCVSQAGYYVGSWCMCGPYTRETEYLDTPVEAERYLVFLRSKLLPPDMTYNGKPIVWDE